MYSSRCADVRDNLEMRGGGGRGDDLRRHRLASAVVLFMRDEGEGDAWEVRILRACDAYGPLISACVAPKVVGAPFGSPSPRLLATSNYKINPPSARWERILAGVFCVSARSTWCAFRTGRFRIRYTRMGQKIMENHTQYM